MLCLLLLSLLMLSGCSSSGEKLEAIEPIPPVESESEAESAPAPAEAPITQNAPVLEDAPMPNQGVEVAREVSYQVQFIAYEQESYATGTPNVLLARCNYAVPHMITTDDQGATLEDDPTAAAFNALFADWDNGTNFAEIESWALGHYESDPTFFGADGPYYADELTCTLYQTGHLVSISGYYYSFTGGAHPNTWLMSWLFDTNTGAFISPLSLATDSQVFLDGVSSLLSQALTQRAAEYDLLPEELYWPDYQEVLADWPSYAVTFDATGMTIGFSPYELAAYAAGPQIFTLPYGDLAPYFSAETISLLSGQAD